MEILQKAILCIFGHVEKEARSIYVSVIFTISKWAILRVCLSTMPNNLCRLFHQVPTPLIRNQNSSADLAAEIKQDATIL